MTYCSTIGGITKPRLINYQMTLIVVHKLCYDSYCSTIGGITKPRLINYQSNISDKQVTFWQLAWSELI